jgi:hypothetical protein
MVKMSKWKDERKRYDDKEIIASKLIAGRFKLTVHHYAGYNDDVWFASCYTLFCRYRLASNKLEEAKSQAKNMLQSILETALEDILK